MKLILRRTSKLREDSKGRISQSKMSKTLIKYMRQDLEENSYRYQQSKKQEKYWDKYCDTFNKQVQAYGKVDTKDLHYFRNKLNKAPKNLDDLAKNKKNWILLRVGGSIYHMHGKDGEYNLKFVSKDGKYEAVYNKNYILQDEKVSLENMGTYNYASPHDKIAAAHIYLDVWTYGKWGNSSNDTTSKAERRNPNTQDKYTNNPDAQLHRTSTIQKYGFIAEQ